MPNCGSRNVVMWSGGLDSTLILHELALLNNAPLVALTISDHMGAQKARFARQARARLNYLKFAKRQGLKISYQEIQVTGSTMMESTGYVNNLVDKTRERSVLREWQVFIPWILPFLRSGDNLSLGYESWPDPQKQNHITLLLKAYAEAVNWKCPPTLSIPRFHTDLLDLYYTDIPRNCVSSCDESYTSKDCGYCSKCAKLQKLKPYVT
jgi:hypothetical protein